MRCKVCGHENQEGSTFCANCGSVLKNEPCTAIYESRPEEETPHSDNNAAPMAVMTKRKKIIAIVVVFILLFSAPFLINSLLSGRLFHSNVKKYVCNAGTDAESYFEVNFDNNTYKYVGSNVWGSNSAFHGFFKGGTLEKSGYISLEKTVNGVKYYTFTNNPWQDLGYYILIDDNAGLLLVYVNDYYKYEFKLQK